MQIALSSNKLITSSYGLFANTFSDSLKSPQKFIPTSFSLKINTPYLITQSGIIDIIGTFKNVKMPKIPLLPHVIFVYYGLFLEKLYSRAELTTFSQFM